MLVGEFYPIRHFAQVGDFRLFWYISNGIKVTQTVGS